MEVFLFFYQELIPVSFDLDYFEGQINADLLEKQNPRRHTEHPLVPSWPTGV